MSNSKITYKVTKCLLISDESLEICINWTEDETQARHWVHLSPEQEELLKYHFNERQIPLNKLKLHCNITKLPEIMFALLWTGRVSWDDWKNEDGKCIKIEGSFKCFLNSVQTSEDVTIVKIDIECNYDTIAYGSLEEDTE